MPKKKKAVFIVQLRDSCKFPELAFQEIEGSIRKHVLVRRVTVVEIESDSLEDAVIGLMAMVEEVEEKEDVEGN